MVFGSKKEEKEWIKKGWKQILEDDDFSKEDKEKSKELFRITRGDEMGEKKFSKKELKKIRDFAKNELIMESDDYI